ncbi:AAC_HP2_G0011550.mRNA.1.CDS.1 [Saccharomyces cerevisiae]|nr:BDF_1d_G0011860.mRNA.1.CDS.1 [Saccharomyces cerevisiae]CAI4362913.1 BDC_1c_G0011870.mRNA.1.CDS.1 [Saccharomyces cerevisiae]CAI4935080.1 BBT_HP_G0034590.mRNA.1.CDS.1 [Saccharomyces cerevisiae]CAI5115609.1 BBT_HP_G0135420.mRNA.1.CDS.1 [Saccharomyces cerevisiae]CAI5148465.1 BBT_HP_G0146160.mRNA.1.CDS.1 [Saccharomyces cerevisiae]
MSSSLLSVLKEKSRSLKIRNKPVKMTSQERMIVHRCRFVDFTPATITSLAFSHKSNINKLTPSDLRLAIGRSNGNIEIWNPRNNWFQEMVIEGGKDRSIEGLCWSNVNGESLRLFSIGGSTVVTEWDLATGLPLRNYDCNSGVIWSISINDSQDKLSVGCDNGTVVLIDISGGPGVLEHDTILMRQEARVLTLAWKKDDFVIGGCSDGRIRIWSAQKNDENMGRLLHTMKVDKAKKESTLVWSVIYLPRTDQIASGDSTGSIKFWDFQFATLNQSFKAHDADVLCLTTDTDNNYVFSAGVDRKIFQFSQNTNKSQKNNRWVNSSNRLLHGNDIRAICAYQSKGADFLVSGGVEKTLVINSLTSFSNGNYRKMPTVEPYSKNVLVNKEQRLVVSWSESTVKIWTMGTDSSTEQNYKLVCKLTLKDDQNISTCSLSPDGQVLVVGRPSTTKVFHLQPVGNKLKVTKLDNDLLLRTSTKLVKFIDNSKIVICSCEDDVFIVDLESEEDEKPQEVELLEVTSTKSSIKVPYINRINHLEVDQNIAVISRGCGVVDILDLKARISKPLARLNNFITAAHINTSRKSVVVITADNKIYEFNMNLNSEAENEDSESVLTQWSKNNTDNLPKEWKTLKENCVGIFSDIENSSRLWFWGATWISRIDFDVDFPINKRRKQKKRTHEGLTITDESNFMNDEEDDEDDDIDMEISENLNVLLNQGNKIKSTDVQRNEESSGHFFFTDKYKPLLFVDLISSNELAIIERNPLTFHSKQKAFIQPKLVF